MPLILYMHILGEIVKLLVTSTVVLVTIMSLGFAIEPLVDGLLDPMALFRVILFVMPLMLTFALPFTAAFSATMVFFRLSSENEVTACLASGISFRELLTPVLSLGLVLTLLVFLMSNFVTPLFWPHVAREITQDVAQLLVAKLSTGEVEEFGDDMILYADAARIVPITEERDPGVQRPYSRLRLDGVAVARLDDRKQVLADYTAELAYVDLYQDYVSERTYATMMLVGVTTNDPSTHMLVSLERQQVYKVELPNPFQQKPEFMSLRELKALEADPLSSAAVRKAKDQLSRAIAATRLLEATRLTLEETGRLSLGGPQRSRFEIAAPTVHRDGSSLLLDSVAGEPVTVIEYRGGLMVRRHEAMSAELTVVDDHLGGEPRVSLELSTVNARDVARQEVSSHRWMPLPRLASDHVTLAPLLDKGIEELIDESGGVIAQQPEAASAVDRSRVSLGRGVVSLQREIASRLHERAAIAVNCLLVL
ncbi:MAG: LptF/LptG family permease, partial [Planctomycetota bacterium]